jgi:hypothetical protein
MSILSQLLHGQITFSQATSEAEQWASKVVSSDPALSQAAQAALSAVKQGASNAIMLADTQLATHAQGIVSGVEGVMDAAVLKATGGLALPAVPLIHAGIETAVSIAKSALDAWALEQKAKLTVQPAQVQQAA